MSHGPLVVELLTRAHRLGIVLEYRPRAPKGERCIAVVHAPANVCDELRKIELELRRHAPDVVEVLARSCTVRTCQEPTWIREAGTDLPWCAQHAGPRGLALLCEEHPDLFPAYTPHACPWLTRPKEH